MRVLYFALVFFLSQRKQNANATQIVLPILHLDFIFHFGKFGLLYTDYEIIFSEFDHHICIKKNKKKNKKRDLKCDQRKFLCVL